MKILAIDPGYDRLGVAIIERLGTEEILVYSACIETNKTTDLPERLFSAANAVEKLLLEHEPDIIAIETIFFNKNIKTAIGVAQMRGILLYLGKKYGCKICEFGPQEIKVAVTGYGGSDKQAVLMMVKQLLKNTPTTALDDEYDAIAVGITAMAHNRN